MVEQVYNPQNFKELLPKALDILENSIHNYFTTKRIKDDIICKEYNVSLRGVRRNDHPIIIIGNSLSYKLIPILTTLKKLGFIEKENQKQWRKIKPINLTPKEFMKHHNKLKRVKL